MYVDDRLPQTPNPSSLDAPRLIASTAVHWAAYQRPSLRHALVVNFLLENGALVDAANTIEEQTPRTDSPSLIGIAATLSFFLTYTIDSLSLATVHWACIVGNAQHCQALIEHGAGMGLSLSLSLSLSPLCSLLT